MIHRILKININDIIFDEKAASNIINKHCFEEEQCLTVVGSCIKGNNVILSLEECSSEEQRYNAYRFVIQSEYSEEAICGEVNSRFFYGFSMIGYYEFENRAYFLFGRHKNKF